MFICNTITSYSFIVLQVFNALFIVIKTNLRCTNSIIMNWFFKH